MDKWHSVPVESGGNGAKGQYHGSADVDEGSDPGFMMASVL
jgi:hypothetical protein